jgi:hypothetical protein
MASRASEWKRFKERDDTESPGRRAGDVDDYFMGSSQPARQNAVPQAAPATGLISSGCACQTNPDATLHCWAWSPASPLKSGEVETAGASRPMYPIKLPKFRSPTRASPSMGDIGWLP